MHPEVDTTLYLEPIKYYNYTLKDLHLNNIEAFLEGSVKDSNFSIEQNKETKLYSFVSYKWHIHPSGHRSSQLWLTDYLHKFNTFDQAAQYANQHIISKLQLTDFWAKQYNVPSKALQMMLIRVK